VEPSVSKYLPAVSLPPSSNTFNNAIMSSQGQAVAKVILKGSENWFEWINQVANYARQLSLWQYVDPDAVGRPALPTKPEMPAAPKPTPAPQPQAPQGEGGEAAAAPPPAPTPVTEEQLRAYDRELTIFRINLSEWQTFSRNLALLDEEIVKTVIATYANYVSGETTADKLAKLKNRLAPSDWAYEEEIRRKYQAVLGKSLAKVSLLAWADDVEDILLRAQKINLPEVQGTYPAKAILGAIKKVNGTFWQYWVEEIEKLQREGHQARVPNGFQMLDHFRRNCRFDSRTNSKEAPGSSFSTYQGKDENGEPTSSSASSSASGGPRKPSSSKNQRAECCGGWHKGGYGECYYL